MWLKKKLLGQEATSPFLVNFASRLKLVYASRWKNQLAKTTGRPITTTYNNTSVTNVLWFSLFLITLYTLQHSQVVPVTHQEALYNDSACSLSPSTSLWCYQTCITCNAQCCLGIYHPTSHPTARLESPPLCFQAQPRAVTLLLGSPVRPYRLRPGEKTVSCQRFHKPKVNSCALGLHFHKPKVNLDTLTLYR